MPLPSKINILFFLSLLATNFVVWSFPTNNINNIDKIFITADASTYNFKTGVNLFEGHIKIDQGNTHLTADKLITKDNEQHKMQEAVAYGLKNKAHYWTITPNEPLFDARAKIIKLYPPKSNVTMEGNVVILQGKNRFQGEIVNYSMKDKIVTVPASKNSRAILIYDPDKS